MAAIFPSVRRWRMLETESLIRLTPFSRRKNWMPALLLFSAITMDAHALTPPVSAGVVPARQTGIWRGHPRLAIPVCFFHGIPFLRLDIDGFKGELFMVDSGAQRTLLNSDESDRLQFKLTSAPGVEVSGFGEANAKGVMVVRSLHLKFGRNTLVKGDMFAASLSRVGAAMGVRIAGIIGYDVLRANPTVVDYASSKVTIFEKESFSFAADARILELPVDESSQLPAVSARIAIGEKDCGDARVVLDTGSDRGLMLYSKFSSERSLEHLTGWSRGENLGVGGESSFLHGLPGSISLGGIQISVPDVSVMDSGEGLAASDHYDALIGSPLLARYAIVFGARPGTVYLADTVGRP